MKYILKSIFIITIIVSCSSCSEENTDIKSEELKLDNFRSDLNIKFEPDDLVFNIDRSDKNANRFDDIIIQLSKLNSQIQNRITNDSDLTDVIYDIKITNSRVLVSNFELLKHSSSKRPGPVNDYGWDCPKGMDLIDVCWSEDCVEDAIDSVFDGFSSGDTVNITVHHGGAFGGVSVCSN